MGSSQKTSGRIQKNLFTLWSVIRFVLKEELPAQGYERCHLGLDI